MKAKSLIKNPPVFDNRVIMLNEDHCEIGAVIALTKNNVTVRTDTGEETSMFTHWLPLPKLENDKIVWKK